MDKDTRKIGGEEDHFTFLDVLFFSSASPLTIDQIKRALGMPGRRETARVVEAYMKWFNSLHKGVRISKTSEKVYLLHVNPEYVDQVRRYIHPPPLTKGQLTTLAYIYANQPVALKTVALVIGRRAYRDVKRLHGLRLVRKKKVGRGIVLLVTEAARYLITSI